MKKKKAFKSSYSATFETLFIIIYYLMMFLTIMLSKAASLLPLLSVTVTPSLLGFTVSVLASSLLSNARLNVNVALEASVPSTFVTVMFLSVPNSLVTSLPSRRTMKSAVSTSLTASLKVISKSLPF